MVVDSDLKILDSFFGAPSGKRPPHCFSTIWRGYTVMKNLTNAFSRLCLSDASTGPLLKSNIDQLVNRG